MNHQSRRVHVPINDEIEKTQWSIVLDIDETLVHTYLEDPEFEKLNEFKIFQDDSKINLRTRFYRLKMIDPVGTKGKGNVVKCWGTKRPHLKEFLDFCFAFFKTVNIWTAGRRAYADEMEKILSRDSGTFNKIYTYDECQDFEKCLNKPLTKLLKDNPEIGSVDSVFILDDRESSFDLNPDNGILIPPYSPDMNLDSITEEDESLLILKNWFVALAITAKRSGNSDVRKIDKSNIFVAE